MSFCHPELVSGVCRLDNRSLGQMLEQVQPDFCLFHLAFSLKFPTIAVFNMKIGILCFTKLGKKNNPSDLLLKKTGILMGHRVRIFRNGRLQLHYNHDQPRLLYKGKRFPKYEVIIVRPGITQNVEVEISSIKQFQLMNFPVVNTYLSIHRAKNKLRTLQILNHENIPVPKTVVVHSLDYLDLAVEKIGAFPIILKAPYGTHGTGVMIFESLRSFKSATEFISKAFKNQLMILQEYVKEAKGKDIRIFVVGGRMVAAMERKARRGEFRANFHRGGSIQIADLNEEERLLALKAVKALGLDIAGVDVLRTNEGPKVLEVNSNPGLEGITKASGINVAEHIINYAVKVATKHQKVKREYPES